MHSQLKTIGKANKNRFTSNLNTNQRYNLFSKRPRKEDLIARRQGLLVEFDQDQPKHHRGYC